MRIILRPETGLFQARGAHNLNVPEPFHSSPSLTAGSSCLEKETDSEVNSMYLSLVFNECVQFSLEEMGSVHFKQSICFTFFQSYFCIFIKLQFKENL